VLVRLVVWGFVLFWALQQLPQWVELLVVVFGHLVFAVLVDGLLHIRGSRQALTGKCPSQW